MKKPRRTMPTPFSRLARAFAAVTIVLLAASCGNGDGTSSPNLLASRSDGSAPIDTKIFAQALVALPIETLSADEIASLKFSREEEKLARDVYELFAASYTLPIFPNIASSEQTHTEAVRTLLVRYSIPDPAASTPPGMFVNPDLQALYDSLVARGRTSLVAALAVGANIEEVDIVDLTRQLTMVDNRDITIVFENLLKASRNHLRSFVSALDARGIVYVPQYLPAAVYQQIVGSPMETGAY